MAELWEYQMFDTLRARSLMVKEHPSVTSQPCPHCQSDNTGLVAKTMRLQIYLCFSCARRFELKKER